MVTPDLKAQAIEWLDHVDAGRGLSGNWRIEVIQKRYRKSREGVETECTDLPLRIRRFLPGCPWALVANVIRELVSRAPYTDIICNGVTFSGKYRPTLTYWTRDESKSVDETRGANGTYTLVQDLVEDSECSDALSIGSQASCQYEEETEYHWDEASVDFTLPGCGPDYCGGAPGCQGITHALAAVQRQEDGSFNYQIVKRIAKTVHTPEVEIRNATCGVGRMTKESWDNVYGEPGDFHYDCGTAITLPTASVGQQVQFSIQMNNDCTYHIEAQIEYAPAPESYEWTDGNPCVKRTVQVRAGDTTMPTIPSLFAGSTVTANIDRRPDCTYSSRIETTKKAAGGSYSWKDNTVCRPRTNTVYYDYSGIPSLPSLGNGERLDASITRNSDCTWDARFSKLAAASSTSKSWEVGSFGHRSTVNYYKDQSSLPSIPKISRGTEVSASLQYSDDCTWSGETRKTVATADRVTWNYGTPCVSVEATTFRNQSAVPADATGVPTDVGKELSSSIEIGDDGLYSGRYAITTKNAWSTDFSEGSLLHSDHTSLFKGANSLPSIPIPSQGVTVQARVDRDSDCSYSGSITTRTANPHEVSWSEGSYCRGGSGRAGRNVSSIPSIGIGRGDLSMSVSINEDGTYDYTAHTRGTTSGGIGSVSEGSSYLSSTTHYYSGATAPRSPGSGGVGVTTSASASFSKDDCTWSGSYSTTRRSTRTVQWTEGTSCAKVSRTINFGTPTSGGSFSSGEYEVSHRSVSINNDGTYDVSDSVTTLSPKIETVPWISTEQGPNSTLTYSNKLTVFSNITIAQVKSLVSGSTGSVRVSLSQSTGCLFSGQISSSRLSSWNLSGSSGGSHTGMASVTLLRAMPDGRLYKGTVTLHTRCYYGTGNEGSRAAAAANCTSISGISLPSGVFGTDAPQFSGWTLV